MRPPAEIAGLQDDIRLFFIDKSIQGPEVGVNVAHDDDFHITDYFLVISNIRNSEHDMHRAVCSYLLVFLYDNSLLSYF